MFDIILFRSGSLCPAFELLPNSLYCAGIQMFGDPRVEEVLKNHFVRITVGTWFLSWHEYVLL